MNRAKVFCSLALVAAVASVAWPSENSKSIFGAHGLVLSVVAVPPKEVDKLDPECMRQRAIPRHDDGSIECVHGFLRHVVMDVLD